MNQNSLFLIENFTIDNYNYVIEKISERKKMYFSNLIISSSLTGLLFSKMQSINSVLDMVIYSLKFSWVLPIPMFVMSNLGKYNLIKKEELYLDTEKITKEVKNKSYKIIFQITTKGNNIKSLERSIFSVKYWIMKINEKYNINLNFEIWIVIDEENSKNLEHLSEEKIRLVIVPSSFSTKNGTKYKARALEYANLLRRKLGLNNQNVWIYHQDEETCIGEDTILGILDFINRNDKLIGCGIIVYPLDWRNSTTFAEEMLRSSDDLRLLSLIKKGKLPFGYHGSHFLVRADLEDEIGWDFGENRAEDMLFHLIVQKNRSKEIGILKGFAYEKAPSSINDFLKQRSRWIKGVYDNIKSKRVDFKDKLTLIYSMIIWYLSLPSIFISITSLLFPGGLSPYLGFIAGFAWYSLIDNYRTGYEMNSIYINEEIDKKKLILNMIKGAILEAIVPWYALLRKTKDYEIIKKDE